MNAPNRPPHGHAAACPYAWFAIRVPFQHRRSRPLCGRVWDPPLHSDLAPAPGWAASGSVRIPV